MQGDIIDQANDLAEKMNESNVLAARKAAKPDQVQNPDGSWPQADCEDCGDEIPLQRLLACGSIRCVYCQTAKEKGRNR